MKKRSHTNQPTDPAGGYPATSHRGGLHTGDGLEVVPLGVPRHEDVARRGQPQRDVEQRVLHRRRQAAAERGPLGGRMGPLRGTGAQSRSPPPLCTAANPPPPGRTPKTAKKKNVVPEADIGPMVNVFIE